LKDPIKRTRVLRDRIGDVEIRDKLGWHYNPIDYAWPVHREYLDRFGSEPKEAVFLGMNPGPWGMGQTGVPFGDPFIVRDWMGLGDDYEIGRPDNMTEERPVIGFESEREEGSGQRLFGYLRDRFGDLPSFFEDHFILNYCPLLMFEPDGSNLTPSDLLKADRQRIYDRCDPYLRDMVGFYDPEVLVGIGKFGTERLEAVFPDRHDEVVRIPHPSPASPIATRDGGQFWIDRVTDRLSGAGLPVD
jgi:single-strand selective monofunctional uracil DNA glycosylase